MKMITLFIALFHLLLCNSCAVELATEPVPSLASGSFTIFLQPLPQEARLLTFSIDTLSVKTEEGAEIPVGLSENIFPAESLYGVQKRLVAADIPPGKYQGIVIRIKSATLRGEDGEVDLLPPAEPLVVAHDFVIIKDRPEILFLSLASERLVTNGVIFTPNFSLWKAKRILTNLKGFVSNSGSDTLTVFNKRKAQVIGAINPGAAPTGMALDQNRGWLYVALSGEDSVTVIDVSTEEILAKVRLRFGDEPTELTLSADGGNLICLNRGSNSVAIIDTGSLFEKARIRLTSKPSWLFMGREEGRAYVLSTASATLSVLDLAGQRVRTSVKFEDSPGKGVLNSSGSLLYLITDFSGNLLEVDAANLTVTKKIFIGSGARTIKFDSATVFFISARRAVKLPLLIRVH